jgi:uncharacterized membrane protein (DUF106 family)
MFEDFFNTIFGPILDLGPATSLLIISFLLTLVITIIYKYATDQKFMKEIKSEIKAIQKEIKLLKDNPKKMMEKNKELMEKNMKVMMHSFRPTIFTLIPLLIIFTWLRSVYSELGDILFGLSWIWIYVISSVVFSLALRKALKIH